MIAETDTMSACNNTKCKVLFLDIDGVLNTESYSERIFVARKREALIRQLPLSSDKLVNKTRDKYGALFDPAAVEQLKRIIDASNCSIVLSSTWRRSGLQVMRSMWKDRDLPGELWNITSQFQMMDRGTEIKDFIELQRTHNINIERYVILDDRCDFLPEQLNYLVECHGYSGITTNIADRAIALFQDDVPV